VELHLLQAWNPCLACYWYVLAAVLQLVLVLPLGLC